MDLGRQFCERQDIGGEVEMEGIPRDKGQVEVLALVFSFLLGVKIIAITLTYNNCNKNKANLVNDKI